MTDLENAFDKNYEQRKIRRSFIYYNIGVFCCWAAYGSIFNLQSSINVEDGLGTTTFAVSYIIQGILSMTLAPIMLKKFGAKICYVVGDASVFLLILSNIYPTYYTLLPASILMFVLQCTTWPSMSMLNVLYARLYSSLSKKSIEHHTISFSGYFFTTFHSSQVFGNLMSYVLLYGIDPITVPVSDSVNCTIGNETSCDLDIAKDYQYCGVNDCQNATIIEKTIEKYKPLNPTSFYVLLAVDFGLVAVATLIQAFLVPNDEVFEKKTKKFEQKMLLHPVSQHRDDVNNCGDRKRQISSIQFAISTIKTVFRHCFQLKFILLLPISLYNPMAMSFVYAELTRSLSSCVLGFQWVGICMCMYGLFDAIFSWVVGKFGRRIGRIPLFLICCAMDCGNYVYVLYWAPNPSMVLSIIAIFGTFGVVDGMLQTIINVTHIDLFPKNQDIVIISWNILVAVGFSIGLGLSTLLCVSTRVYVNLGFLVVGTVGAVTAELYNRGTQQTKKEEIVNAVKMNQLQT